MLVVGVLVEVVVVGVLVGVVVVGGSAQNRN